MLLPTFAGVLREKIRTRASFTKILANYASKESLIAAAYGENINWIDFSCKEVSGACKLWKNRMFFNWIYLNLSGIGCRSTSKMAAWSYSQGISQHKWVRLYRYSDWLSRYRHLKLEQLKNKRGVLRKWTPRDKYFKHQNFPTHFRLSLFLKCFGEVWRKSDKSIYIIKSVKVVVFLIKLNARF